MPLFFFYSFQTDSSIHSSPSLLGMEKQNTQAVLDVTAVAAALAIVVEEGVDVVVNEVVDPIFPIPNRFSATLYSVASLPIFPFIFTRLIVVTTREKQLTRRRVVALSSIKPFGGHCSVVVKRAEE